MNRKRSRCCALWTKNLLHNSIEMNKSRFLFKQSWPTRRVLRIKITFDLIDLNKTGPAVDACGTNNYIYLTKLWILNNIAHNRINYQPEMTHTHNFDLSANPFNGQDKRDITRQPWNFITKKNHTLRPKKKFGFLSSDWFANSSRTNPLSWFPGYWQSAVLPRSFPLK